jgi:hypothetical protein
VFSETLFGQCDCVHKAVGRRSCKGSAGSDQETDRGKPAVESRQVQGWIQGISDPWASSGWDFTAVDMFKVGMLNDIKEPMSGKQMYSSL